jgi:hypothetical protein
MLCVGQPLFMPGILFNSIKSGLAVSWPASPINIPSDPSSEDTSLIQKSVGIWTMVYQTGSSGQEQDISVSQLNYKLPFETILNPYNNFSNMYNHMAANYPAQAIPYTASVYNYFDLEDPTGLVALTYLDPTSYSENKNYTDGKTYLIKSNLSTILSSWENDKIGYRSAINNFLAETTNFFLKNASLVNFVSKKQKEFTAVSGTTYAMDIVIAKHSSFSMFNEYSTTDGNKVPVASLFGPPVSHSNTLESPYKPADVSSDTAYLPYTPSYFSGRDVYTVSYTAKTAGDVTIEDILSDLQTSYVTDSSMEASKKRMPISDSISWNIKRYMDELQYDKNSGLNNTPAEYYLKDNRSWVIQTKFESPLLNFSRCSLVESGSYIGIEEA